MGQGVLTSSTGKRASGVVGTGVPSAAAIVRRLESFGGDVDLLVANRAAKARVADALAGMHKTVEAAVETGGAAKLHLTIDVNDLVAELGRPLVDRMVAIWCDIARYNEAYPTVSRLEIFAMQADEDVSPEVKKIVIVDGPGWRTYKTLWPGLQDQKKKTLLLKPCVLVCRGADVPPADGFRQHVPVAECIVLDTDIAHLVTNPNTQTPPPPTPTHLSSRVVDRVLAYWFATRDIEINARRTYVFGSCDVARVLQQSNRADMAFCIQSLMDPLSNVDFYGYLYVAVPLFDSVKARWSLLVADIAHCLFFIVDSNPRLAQIHLDGTNFYSDEASRRTANHLILCREIFRSLLPQIRAAKMLVAMFLMQTKRNLPSVGAIQPRALRKSTKDATTWPHIVVRGTISEESNIDSGVCMLEHIGMFIQLVRPQSEDNKSTATPMSVRRQKIVNIVDCTGGTTSNQQEVFITPDIGKLCVDSKRTNAFENPISVSAADIVVIYMRINSMIASWPAGIGVFNGITDENMKVLQDRYNDYYTSNLKESQTAIDDQRRLWHNCATGGNLTLRQARAIKEVLDEQYELLRELINECKLDYENLKRIYAEAENTGNSTEDIHDLMETFLGWRAEAKDLVDLLLKRLLPLTHNGAVELASNVQLTVTVLEDDPDLADDGTRNRKKVARKSHVDKHIKRQVGKQIRLEKPAASQAGSKEELEEKIETNDASIRKAEIIKKKGGLADKYLDSIIDSFCPEHWRPDEKVLQKSSDAQVSKPSVRRKNLTNAAPPTQQVHAMRVDNVLGADTGAGTFPHPSAAAEAATTVAKKAENAEEEEEAEEEDDDDDDDDDESFETPEMSDDDDDEVEDVEEEVEDVEDVEDVEEEVDEETEEEADETHTNRANTAPASASFETPLRGPSQRNIGKTNVQMIMNGDISEIEDASLETLESDVWNVHLSHFLWGATEDRPVKETAAEIPPPTPRLKLEGAAGERRTLLDIAKNVSCAITTSADPFQEKDDLSSIIIWNGGVEQLKVGAVVSSLDTSPRRDKNGEVYKALCRKIGTHFSAEVTDKLREISTAKQKQKTSMQLETTAVSIAVQREGNARGEVAAPDASLVVLSALPQDLSNPSDDTVDTMFACYAKAFEACNDKSTTSVALPIMGAGPNHKFPYEAAVYTALLSAASVLSQPENGIRKIVVCVPADANFAYASMEATRLLNVASSNAARPLVQSNLPPLVQKRYGITCKIDRNPTSSSWRTFVQIDPLADRKYPITYLTSGRDAFSMDMATLACFVSPADSSNQTNKLFRSIQMALGARFSEIFDSKLNTAQTRKTLKHAATIAISTRHVGKSLSAVKMYFIVDTGNAHDHSSIGQLYTAALKAAEDDASDSIVLPGGYNAYAAVAKAIAVYAKGSLTRTFSTLSTIVLNVELDMQETYEQAIATNFDVSNPSNSEPLAANLSLLAIPEPLASVPVDYETQFTPRDYATTKMRPPDLGIFEANSRKPLKWPSEAPTVFVWEWDSVIATTKPRGVARGIVVQNTRVVNPMSGTEAGDINATRMTVDQLVPLVSLPFLSAVALVLSSTGSSSRQFNKYVGIISTADVNDAGDEEVGGARLIRAVLYAAFIKFARNVLGKRKTAEVFKWVDMIQARIIVVACNPARRRVHTLGNGWLDYQFGVLSTKLPAPDGNPIHSSQFVLFHGPNRNSTHPVRNYDSITGVEIVEENPFKAFTEDHWNTAMEKYERKLSSSSSVSLPASDNVVAGRDSLLQVRISAVAAVA